jgi:hypothetical protein
MTIQRSVAARNAALDAFESTAGTAPLLRIFTGAQPANCAAASSGTLLVEMTLPSDWLNAASSGTKAKSAGAWSGTGVADGTAGHYRIFDSTGSVCHEQGSCGIGTGDLQLDNTSIAIGQTVTVTGYTITAGNA